MKQNTDTDSALKDPHWQQPTSLTGKGAVLVSQGRKQCWCSFRFTCTDSWRAPPQSLTLRMCTKGPWSFSLAQPAVRQGLWKFPAERQKDKDEWWEEGKGRQMPRCSERMAEHPKGNMAEKVASYFNQQKPSVQGQTSVTQEWLC